MAGTPPHLLWGGLGHLTNALPPVRLGLSSYLFVYLFIYLFIILFNLLSSRRDGLASPAGLGGQGARQGEDSKGHRGLSPHTLTPSWGVREQPHPYQSLHSLGKGTQKRGDDRLLTLPVMGQVPTFLSLPLPLQETGERSLLICFLFTPLLEGPQVPGTD